MTTSRLSLANPLRTRPGDYYKDARMVNAYPDESGGMPILRKRAAAKALGGASIGPTAQLMGSLLEAHVGIVGAGGGLVTINETSTSSTASFTSATKTTGANCTSITPNVSFLSVRGQGDGTWMYRSVRWRVEYYNGSSWVAGSYRIVSMGAQSATPVTDTVTYTFTSAGVWQWRIYAEAYDTNGTAWGSVTYVYSTETLYSETGNFSLNTTTSLVTVEHTWALPSSVLNATWELYKVDYSMSFTLTKTGSNGIPEDYQYIDETVVSYGICPITNGATSSATKTKTTAGPYNINALKIKNQFVGGTNAAKNFSANVTSGSATLYRRNVTSSNSTTASNVYTVTSYSEAYAVDNSASSITDATKALITVVNDDVSIYDLTLLP